MSRRARGSTSSNRPLTIVAIVLIVFLLASSLLILIPFGGGGDDAIDDDVARVTPGAEVSRLETAVANDPDNVDTMIVLAEVLANSGRINESIPWFERAIAQQPDDATLRLAFGRALQRAGNDFDAELQLRRAVELDPTDPAAPFYLGLFYETRQPPETEKAKEWYQRAIESDPDSVIAGQARDRAAALDSSGTPTSTP